MSSVGSFFSYVKVARSHEPEETPCLWEISDVSKDRDPFTFEDNSVQEK